MKSTETYSIAFPKFILQELIPWFVQCTVILLIFASWLGAI